MQIPRNAFNPFPALWVLPALWAFPALLALPALLVHPTIPPSVQFFPGLTVFGQIRTGQAQPYLPTSRRSVFLY